MKTNKLVVTTLASLLTLSALTACGKSSSPYANIPNNNNGVFNPNPNDPNYNNGINSPIGNAGSIIGRVIDATGKGLPNVTVSVKNVSTTSNMTGDFQLNNVPPGQQTVLLRFGNRQLTINANVTADTSVSPDVNPIQFSNNGTGGSGFANVQLKTFKVDQDFLNQWQAKGVAVSNGVVYATVADNTSLFKKGSVVKMDAEGANWKNIGSSWLGLRYPLDKTIQGIDINGTNLAVVDSKGSLYNIENNKKVKSYKTGPGTHVAVGAGSVFIV
ncbi:carboxypeptidase regulatory-like domain-containing protein, partial [bacterium]